MPSDCILCLLRTCSKFPCRRFFLNLLRLPVLAELLLAPAWLVAGEGPQPDYLDSQALKRMTVDELMQQEVVSTSRHSEEWRTSPSNLFRLSGRAPQVTGATTLPQVLRLAPQLFVGQLTSSNSAISARGFIRPDGYSNKLLVMIDGRTIYSPFFSNVFWNAQDVFLPDLDRIEVISGPAGANWGANAVNGVISILSKTAFETQGGLLYAGVGTNDEYHFGLRQGGRWGSDSAWRIYAKQIEFGATPDLGNQSSKDGWRFRQAGFRTDTRIGEQNVITIQGDAYQGRYQDSSAPGGEAEGANLLARWNRRLFNGGEVWARIYHDYANRDLTHSFHQTTHTTDIEFQHHFYISDNQEVVWGGNYRVINDEIRIHDTQSIVLPPELTYESGSIFGQHELHLVHDSVRIISGLRVEYNHFSGWEPLPSLRIAWIPSRNVAVWTAGSRATRIPDRFDSGWHHPATPPYSAAGGPDFTSEVLHAFELGARFNPAQNVALTATLFLHEYDNLRSLERRGDTFITANGSAGRSRGLELFLDWDAFSWWRIRTGGFYVDQDTWVQPGRIDYEQAPNETSFPKFQFQFRSTFRINDAITLWLGLRHVDYVPIYSYSQEGAVPAYTELDASINWRIRTGLELSLTGRNLLDSAHFEMGGDDFGRQIRRSANVMVRWSY